MANSSFLSEKLNVKENDRKRKEKKMAKEKGVRERKREKVSEGTKTIF